MYAAIGSRIRRQRKKKNLTQEELAEMCGISLSFMGHIERGSRKLSVDTLYRIVNALNYSADELLGIYIESNSEAIHDEITNIISDLQVLKKRFE